MRYRIAASLNTLATNTIGCFDVTLFASNNDEGISKQTLTRFIQSAVDA